MTGKSENENIAGGGRARGGQVAGQSKKCFWQRRVGARQRRSKRRVNGTTAKNFFFQLPPIRVRGGTVVPPRPEQTKFARFPRPSPSEWGPDTAEYLAGSYGVFAIALLPSALWRQVSMCKTFWRNCFWCAKKFCT